MQYYEVPCRDCGKNKIVFEHKIVSSNGGPVEIAVTRICIIHDKEFHEFIKIIRTPYEIDQFWETWKAKRKKKK